MKSTSLDRQNGLSGCNGAIGAIGAIYAVCNVRIVKCHTGRVLLYYSEGYIKKGTPKVFRRCEIVIIILRRLVRVNESSKEYY